MRRTNLSWLHTSIARLSVILFTTALGAAALAVQGRVPVVRGSTPLPEMVPYWYMLAAFPVLGMLLADLASFWASYRLGLPTLELGTMIGLLVILSTFRLGFWIPLSGHALLFAYAAVRRLLIPWPAHRGARLELALVVLLWTLTSYVKVFWWDDLLTAGLGTAAGAALALVSLLLSKRFSTVHSE